jgi:uncharacterized membrane protein YphA (DoxX/SURF4 family)
MKIARYGWLALFTFFALRLGIGFHFFSEGFEKIRHPKPFSSYFFLAAKGPFAEKFQEMAWDPDGLARLGYVASTEDAYPSIDSEPTQKLWTDYGKKVAVHYGFTDEEGVAADEIVDRYNRQLAEFGNTYTGEIYEYFLGVERRDIHREKVKNDELTTTLWEHTKSWESDLAGKRAPLLAEIDGMWVLVEADLNALATPEQAERGRFPLEKIGRKPLDSEAIDKVIPWFDCTIGVLLILGLLTRLASVAGAAFLMGVVVTQWPGAIGAASTWPQFIEMLSLLTLAAVGAGRIGGLDHIIGRCFRPKKQEQSE